MQYLKTIYILLPVHNRINHTLQFAQCLSRQTYTNYHLILIDDGSTDGTSQEIKKIIPQCEIISGKGNWWWGGSLQKGFERLKKVKDGYVLICNDDTTFDNDFLQDGIKKLDAMPDTLLLAAPYNHVTGKLIDTGVYFDFKKNKMHLAKQSSEIDFMSTRGLFLRIKDFIKVGGFKPLLLPHYYSDYEFTHRAKQKGFKLVCDTALRINSVESATGTKDVSGEKNFGAFINKMFSKRYDMNPVYTSNFILLTFPFPYNFKYGLMTYYDAFKRIVKFAIK